MPWYEVGGQRSCFTSHNYIHHHEVLSLLLKFTFFGRAGIVLVEDAAVFTDHVYKGFDQLSSFLDG